MTDLLSTYKSQLLGTWKLHSIIAKSDPASGSVPVGQPLGPNPLGRITFNPDGFMSCTITDPAHTKPFEPAVEWAQAEEKDIAFAAKRMITYCGPYSFSIEEGEEKEGDGVLLSTDVEISLDPGWMGTKQVRRVTVKKEGEKLLLTLKPVQYIALPNGMKVSGVVEWEKAAY